MRTQLFPLLLVSISRLSQQGADDNLKEFNVLCGIFDLINSKPDPNFAIKTKNFEKLRTKLFNLNVSVAPQSFHTDRNETAHAEMKKADEAARKTAWQEKIQQITATTANGGKDRPYAKIRDGPAQQKAAATVSAILAAPDEMRQRHETLKHAATQAHSLAIKATKDAVYGMDKEEPEDTFLYTKSTKCGGTTTTGTAGAAIVEDLICLCTKGSGGKTTECYTPGPAEINNNKVNGVKDVVNDMTESCQKMSAGLHLTPTLIAQKIGAFYAELSLQTAGQPASGGITQYVLGKYSSSGCTVTATQQCINYAGELGKEKNGIRWEKILKSAEQHLQAGSHAAAELSSMTHILQATVQQAEMAGRAAAIEQEAEMVARVEADRSCAKEGNHKKNRNRCDHKNMQQENRCRNMPQRKKIQIR
uniref:Variant surface glycoprotein n=1 Tax=Trypanosoma brucei TaxID=5691 RepID=A0A1V0FYA9_9TRYP|nr:variant surface glycoprotein [Trypanosoma brucei]